MAPKPPLIPPEIKEIAFPSCEIRSLYNTIKSKELMKDDQRISKESMKMSGLLQSSNNMNDTIKMMSFYQTTTPKENKVERLNLSISEINYIENLDLNGESTLAMVDLHINRDSNKAA